MQVTVAKDLAVAIGDRTTHLSPGEAFRLAENLIRRATVCMITQEVDRSLNAERRSASQSAMKCDGGRS
jgi:hypothetical protein